MGNEQSRPPGAPSGGQQQQQQQSPPQQQQQQQDWPSAHRLGSTGRRVLDEDDVVPYTSFSVSRAEASPNAAAATQSAAASAVTAESVVAAATAATTTRTADGIIIVNQAPQLGGFENVEPELAALRKLASFTPLLKNTGQPLSWADIFASGVAGNGLDVLDPKRTLLLAQRYQLFMKKCARTVCHDQKLLVTNMRQMDAFVARIAGQINARAGQANYYSDQFKNVVTLGQQLEKTNEVAAKVIQSLELLNDLLPEGERLESILVHPPFRDNPELVLARSKAGQAGVQSQQPPQQQKVKPTPPPVPTSAPSQAKRTVAAPLVVIEEPKPVVEEEPPRQPKEEPAEEPEQPKQEEPKQEEPKQEEPKHEEPEQEQEAPELPKQEETKHEEPEQEQDAPVQARPGIDQPETKIDETEPEVDQPEPTEPLVEQPASSGSASAISTLDHAALTENPWASDAAEVAEVAEPNDDVAVVHTAGSSKNKKKKKKAAAQVQL